MLLSCGLPIKRSVNDGRFLVFLVFVAHAGVVGGVGDGEVGFDPILGDLGLFAESPKDAVEGEFAHGFVFEVVGVAEGGEEDAGGFAGGSSIGFCPGDGVGEGVSVSVGGFEGGAGEDGLAVARKFVALALDVVEPGVGGERFDAAEDRVVFLVLEEGD